MVRHDSPDDSEIHASGRVATGRTFQAGQDKGSEPDTKVRPGPPRCGLAVVSHLTL